MMGRNQEQQMQEPSLFEEDYSRPRTIPSESEALSTLSDPAQSEERSWLTQAMVEAGVFDEFTPDQQAEVLRLIIKHGSPDIKKDLCISLRCFLHEMEDVQSCTQITYRSENESD
jgi:hypothetical protein